MIRPLQPPHYFFLFATADAESYLMSTRQRTIADRRRPWNPTFFGVKCLRDKSAWLRNTLITLVFITPMTTKSPAFDSPLGGFLPLVGIGLTDEFKNSNSGDVLFFMADPSNTPGGSFLSGNASTFFDIALLDTGAATHILNSTADGPSGFDIAGNGFDGNQIQPIGGATGTVDLIINDPHGIYVAGLSARNSTSSTLTMDPLALRGQTNFATLSAPVEWTLPNIIGLPMAAQHAIKIKNDSPQIFELGGRTIRTPDVELIELGSGMAQGIQRRLPLELRPGLGFVQGPVYVLNTGGILLGEPLHENPQSPTILENGALFVDVDLVNGTKSLEDTGMLFDTGADLTVVSELTAVRLGFDPILDTADFVLQVEGSGGVTDGVPGFFVDQLSFDSIGGSFSMSNVPIAVLDVTNPSDPGNIIPGIIGMHLFNGRNLVIDTNPSVGQGGTGPSVYISDPVTTDYQWSTNAASGQWTAPENWNTDATPDPLGVMRLANFSGTPQRAMLDSHSTVFRTVVSGEPFAEMAVDILSGNVLTVFADLTLQDNGHLHLANGTLDAQFVQIDGGLFSGSGYIFVGSGPIHTAVRNGGGVIAPGDADGNSIGLLEINGDFAQTTPGTLQIELAGTGTGGTDYDQITASRYGFLGGTLEVSLVDAFTPQVGSSFEILSVSEQLSGVFEDLVLPNGYQWNVRYDTSLQHQRVLLEVLGLGLLGDFNASGQYDSQDIDTLFTHLSSSVPPTDASFDLISDGVINQADVDQLVQNLMNRQYGDTDLDQDVDITDFGRLANHFSPQGNGLVWAQGNFDGDGDVDVTDFNILAVNFAPTGYGLSTVPEPSGQILLIAGILAVLVHGTCQVKYSS